MENRARQRERLRPLMQASSVGSAEIDLVGVSKAYGRGSQAVHALDDVSLRVAHNEFVSVLGPSGCGKSTLVLLVAGLLSPSEGSIMLQGRPVDGPRRTNGIVFQDAVMLPWRTVVDNVLLPIDLMGEDVRHYRARAFELLNIAG